MPTQLYDGPTLDDLLTRIKSEHGTNARIVAVKKARRGGIAGFFSRDWFEVTVEVVPSKRTEKETADANASLSILDIAEAVNEKESTVEVEVVGGPFKSTLNEMRAENSTTRGNTAVIDGLQAAQEFADQLKVLREKNDREQPQSVPEDPFVEVEFPLAASAVDEQPEFEIPSFVNSAPVIVQSDDTLSISEELLTLYYDGLIARGVPRALLSGLNTSENINAQLEQAFEGVAGVADAELMHSKVIAVVGPTTEVNRMTKLIAQRVQTTTQNVYIASRDGNAAESSRLIADADDARAVKRSWKRRTDITVIGIPLDEVGFETMWAEEILSAVEPEFTLLIADARNKTEDIEATVESLVGIDALAVKSLPSTTTPASAMHLGIPIAYVEDRIATPSLWAAMLTEGLLQ